MEADPEGSEAGAGRPDRPHEAMPGPDWVWRHKVRGHPIWGRPYRVAVAVIGWIIVIAGLIMVPLPGQGWLTVLFGVAILATEYVWAHRLLVRGRRWLKSWTRWILAQNWAVRGLVALATFVLVVGAMWLVLRITGVPSYLPDRFEDALHLYGGL